MKRYILFGGDIYYAHGGAHDLVAMFDDIDDFTEPTLNQFYSWWNIWDCVEQRIVKQSERHSEWGY